MCINKFGQKFSFIVTIDFCITCAGKCCLSANVAALAAYTNMAWGKFRIFGLTRMILSYNSRFNLANKVFKNMNSSVTMKGTSVR